MHFRPLVKMGFATFARQHKQYDLIILCHDVDRGINLNGKAASQILDLVADQLEKKGFSCLRVASLGSSLTGEKAYKEPISLRSIKRKIKLKLLIRSLIKGKKLRRKYKQRVVAKKLYEELLFKTKAKVVLAISPEPILCQIGYDKKIAIIEACHGFGLPPNCPVTGAKARSRISERYEPAFYISFDTMTHKTRSEGDLGKKTKSLIAQRPLINEELFRQSYGFKEIVQCYGKRGLITMQWGYDGEATFLRGIIPDGVMHPALLEIIQKRKDITWLIRFHPMQTRRKEKWRKIATFIKDNLYSKGLTVIDVSFLPLDFVLSQADFHITMMSGAVYESASSGVRSIALCPTIHPGGINEEFFTDLEKEGMLQKCKLDASLIGLKIDELSSPTGDNRLSASDAPEMAEVVSKILLGRDDG